MGKRITSPCGRINSRFLQKYRHLIETFSKCPVDVQLVIIGNATLDFSKLLCELCLNVLYNTVGLSKKCIVKLKQYKKLILYMVDRKISLRAKAKKLKNNKERNRKFVQLLFKCISKNL